MENKQALQKVLPDVPSVFIGPQRLCRVQGGLLSKAVSSRMGMSSAGAEPRRAKQGSYKLLALVNHLTGNHFVWRIRGDIVWWMEFRSCCIEPTKFTEVEVW